MTTSAVSPRIEASKRIMRTLGVRPVPLVTLDDGSSPIVVALPNDYASEVLARVRAVGGSANVTVAFKEYKTLEEQLKELNLQSSDHSKRRTIRKGDTIGQIAFEEYGDPAMWRLIALEPANAAITAKESDYNARIKNFIRTLPQLRDLWVIDAEGRWIKGESDFARKDATLYNARVAWAMAEAGAALSEPGFTDAAARNLRMVARQQQRNGWFPNCCLSDPVRPLLHTVAYTIRGLLEGGRVLQDAALVDAGIRAAEALLPAVRADGWMPGRYAQDWRGAVQWSCLTGEAQMVNNWIRLGQITGDARWFEPLERVLTFVKRTQNRTSADPGLRGGIKGSAPMSGGYGQYEILNWATKYFADALIRDDQRTGGILGARGNGVHRLA